MSSLRARRRRAGPLVETHVLSGVRLRLAPCPGPVERMATENDVQRIVLALPETRQEEGRFAFGVMNKGKSKGIVWVWMERVDPKKPRVPKRGVVAIRVASLQVKEALLASDPGQKKFFTEPHYSGYPAVLVRLAAIRVAELTELITEAWRCQAPKALAKELER